MRKSTWSDSTFLCKLWQLILQNLPMHAQKSSHVKYYYFYKCNFQNNSLTIHEVALSNFVQNPFDESNFLAHMPPLSYLGTLILANLNCLYSSDGIYTFVMFIYRGSFIIKLQYRQIRNFFLFEYVFSYIFIHV